MKMNVSGKIILVLSITIVFVLSIAFYLITSVESKRLFSELKRTALVVSTSIEKSTSKVMSDFQTDKRHLQALTEHLGNIKSVKWVEVFDREATIIAHTKNERISSKPLEIHKSYIKEIFKTGKPVNEEDKQNGVYNRFIPVYDTSKKKGEEEVIGVVELVMDMKFMSNNIASLRLKMILTVIVLIVVILATILWYIRRTVILPIFKLLDMTKKVAKGNFAERVIITSNDELGRLGTSFNKMIEDLDKTTTSIKYLNQDIRKRRKVEETLKESESRFRDLVKSAPDSILIVDRNNRIIIANDQTEMVYGYSIDELIGQSHDILLPERFRQIHDKHRSNYLSRPHSREMGANLDLVCRRKDGSEIPVEISLSPLITKEGKQVICVTRDITERKKAEEELRQKVQEQTAFSSLSQQVSSSLSLDQVVSAALDEVTTALAPDLTLFFMREGDNLILKGMRSGDPKYRHDETPVHRVGECLCGLAVSKGIPMYSSDILNDPRCTWEECKKADLRSFAALPLFGKDEIIGVLGLASGTSREFEKQSIFLETFANEISTGLQNAIFHMQVQKHAEELEATVAKRTDELTRANTRLKELDHLKSMFIASMSHELRTPLNSIMGFTGIILQGMVGKISDEQRKQLTMVKNSATHLLSLINDIIDVSKIEAGKVDIYIHKFDLQSVVKEVINSFTVLADEKNLKIDLKIPKKIIIESDERRVKQILVNFVSNALKFTDTGSVSVNVYLTSDSAVEISVADTGIGIKKEHMGKLFKAFSRIPVEGVIKEGTGLGLYLSRKIAELLGCEIKVDSEFGKGSVFTLTLPLRCI